MFSKIEVNIENLDISNLDNRQNNEQITVKIKLKFLKLTWAWAKLDYAKMKKLELKIKKAEEKNKGLQKKINARIKQDLKIILKKQNVKKEILKAIPRIKKFEAKIAISTENFVVTSYAVAVISIGISNILPHIISSKVESLEKCIRYNVKPLYIEKNGYSIKLSIDFTTEILRIIKTALMIKKFV